MGMDDSKHGKTGIPDRGYGYSNPVTDGRFRELHEQAVFDDQALFRRQIVQQSQQSMLFFGNAFTGAYRRYGLKSGCDNLDDIDGSCDWGLIFADAADEIRQDFFCEFSGFLVIAEMEPGDAEDNGAIPLNKYRQRSRIIILEFYQEICITDFIPLDGNGRLLTDWRFSWTI